MIDPKLQQYADECLAKAAPKVRYVGTNVTDLHRGPSFLEELFTQVFNGMKIEVLEEKEKWCFVRDESGYVGYSYGPYLADSKPPAGTHIVAAPIVNVMKSIESVEAPLTRLLSGTTIAVTESRDGRLKIDSSGWVHESDVRSLKNLPLTSETARKQIVSDARRLTGTYYLWGANTAFGTDCSGLAMLTHRLSGYALPRDADMQFAAGKSVSEPFQPGDLIFFHNEARTKIGHVGISTGGWNMIHSSRSRNGVYEEDVQTVEHLRNSFAGARTFLK